MSTVFAKCLPAFLFLKACRDFLSLAQSHSRHWQKALQVERNQRIRLEETLEQLAKQHNHLERAFRGATVLPPHNNPASGSKGEASHQRRRQSFAFMPTATAQSGRFPFSVGSVSPKGDASDEDDDHEFFDAMQDPAEFITVPADPKYHRSAAVVVVTVLLSQRRRFTAVCVPLPGDRAAASVASAVRLELMISR